MSRREDLLITNRNEACLWLEEFQHTITDRQAVSVIEALEQEDPEATTIIRELEIELECAEDRIDELNKDYQQLKQELEILKESRKTALTDITDV